MLSVSRYRFRATFGRRWGGYLALVLLLVLIAGGALVLANVVAAIPARAASRTPTALMLRAE